MIFVAVEAVWSSFTVGGVMVVIEVATAAVADRRDTSAFQG